MIVILYDVIFGYALLMGMQIERSSEAGLVHSAVNSFFGLFRSHLFILAPKVCAFFGRHFYQHPVPRRPALWFLSVLKAREAG